MRIRRYGYIGNCLEIFESKGIFKCCSCGKFGFYIFYPELCTYCMKSVMREVMKKIEELWNKIATIIIITLILGTIYIIINA